MASSNFIVRGGADFSGIKKGLDKTQKQLNSFQKTTNKSMSAVGTAFKLALGYVSVRAIAGFVKSTTKLASDLTEVQNVVDVTFGSMAKDINAFADTAIESFGLSTLSAKKYSSSMGAMLKSSGIAGTGVKDMAVELTKLSADMASFYNLDNDVAFKKIMSGMSGMTMPLKELGINMNVANLEAYALSRGMGKTYANMSQAEKTMVRYNYLLSVSADAQGDFSRNSLTWANQTKTLSQQFDTLKATIGTGFINALAPIVTWLNKIIKKLQVAAESFKAFTTAIFGESNQGSGGGASVAIDGMTDGLEDVTEASEKAKGSLAGFDEINSIDIGGDAEDSADIVAGGSNVLGDSATAPDTSWVDDMRSKLQGLAKIINNAFAPSIKSWGKAFESLGKPLEKAFSSVSSSTKKLWNQSLAPLAKKMLTDFYPSIVNGFSTTFAPIFEESMPTILEQLTKDFEFICNTIGKIIKDVYVPALDFMKQVSIDIFGSIKNSWDLHGEGLLNGFKKFKEGIREIWTSIYDSVFKPVFDNIGKLVTGLWNKHFKQFWDNMIEFVGAFANLIMVMWNDYLQPFVSYMVERVGPPIVFAFGIIADVIGTILGVTADLVSGLVKALSGFIKYLTGVFSGDWKKAWDGIKQYYVGIWNAIYGVFKGVFNLIIDGLNLLWGGIYFTVKSIVDSIGGIAGALGKLFGQDWKFSMPKSMPKIPKLASGAIVSGRTIVEVGEYAGAKSDPEVISPLSKLKSMISDVGGGVSDVLLEKILGVLESIDSKPSETVVNVNDRELARATNSGNRALGYAVRG